MQHIRALSCGCTVVLDPRGGFGGSYPLRSVVRSHISIITPRSDVHGHPVRRTLMRSSCGLFGSASRGVQHVLCIVANAGGPIV